MAISITGTGGVTIDGFTITSAATGIDLQVANLVIENNIITGTGGSSTGIDLSGTSAIAGIYNNSISDVGNGIYSNTSSGPVTIQGNAITPVAGDNGISLTSVSNTIQIGGTSAGQGNTVTGGAYGINLIDNSSTITVQNNTLTSPTSYGIFANAETQTGTITIQGNTISGPSTAVKIENSGGNVQVGGLTAGQGNTISGVSFGVYTDDDDNDTVQGNGITTVTTEGIIGLTPSGNFIADDNTISGTSYSEAILAEFPGGSFTADSNTISGTTYSEGIEVDGAGGTTTIGDAVGDGNSITNAGTAIFLPSGGATTNIQGNTLDTSTSDAISVSGVTGTLTIGGSATLAGNTIAGTPVGIYLSGNNTSTVQGNGLTGITTTGVDMTAGGSTTGAITGNTVTGTSGTTGVLLEDSNGAVSATLTGNAVSGFTTDVSVASTGAGVTATIGGVGMGVSNSLSGATTGIAVSGTNASAIIEGNTAIHGNTTGVLVSSGGASLTSNTIYSNTTGVKVSGGSPTLTSNTIYGNTTGVLVNGGSSTLVTNHIYDNTTGISFTSGGSGAVSTGTGNGNNFDFGSSTPATENSTDLLIGATAGTVTIGDGNAFAGHTALTTGYYINNQSTQDFDFHTYTTTTFKSTALGVINPSTLGTTLAADLGKLYTIQNGILDYLDNGTSGYVVLKAGDVFLAHTSETSLADSLQRAIDIPYATHNNTIYVQAGTYVGGSVLDSPNNTVYGVSVDEPVTIIGPNSTYNPTTALTPANAQAIIEPGTSQPNPGGSDSVAVLGINSANVTIEGLTIQGSNSGLSHAGGAPVLGGVTIDAAEGIASYNSFGSLTVENSIVDYTAYAGVDIESGPVITGNVVTEDLVQNLSDSYGFGVGVLLATNAYTSVTSNVIQSVRVGVQTNGFTLTNTGSAGSISSNTIAAYSADIFYNEMSEPSDSAFTVSGNTLNAASNASYSQWSGLLIDTDSDAAIFSTNTISGSAANAATNTAGYQVYNDAPAVTLSGGTVTGVDFGVWANTYEANDDAATATDVIVTGMSISATQPASTWKRAPSAAPLFAWQRSATPRSTIRSSASTSRAPPRSAMTPSKTTPRASSSKAAAHWSRR